jgi:phage terminase small subunit
MAGRPRKPTQKKALEGDLRKVGQQKHDAMLEAAVLARRGMPKMPEWMQEPQSEIEKIAAEYWETTADGLHREGLLATVDEGILTSISLAYASMVVAGRAGLKSFSELMQRYMQAADRMGLNESARAKFTKPKPGEGDPELDAMSSFLGEGAQGSDVIC